MKQFMTSVFLGLLVTSFAIGSVHAQSPSVNDRPVVVNTPPNDVVNIPPSNVNTSPTIVTNTTERTIIPSANTPTVVVRPNMTITATVFFLLVGAVVLSLALSIIALVLVLKKKFTTRQQ